MLIDDYIKKVEETLELNNQNEAEILYNELYGLYRKEIQDFDLNTSERSAKINMVINLNYDNPNDMLSTDIDYINDLRIVLPRLKKYAEAQRPLTTTTNNIYNGTVNTYNGNHEDSSINISNSTVSNSKIGCKSENIKSSKTKIIVTIISVLAGIATIVGTIIGILQALGKI